MKFDADVMLDIMEEMEKQVEIPIQSWQDVDRQDELEWTRTFYAHLMLDEGLIAVSKFPPDMKNPTAFYRLTYKGHQYLDEHG